jgi:hypothetical protein
MNIKVLNTKYFVSAKSNLSIDEKYIGKFYSIIPKELDELFEFIDNDAFSHAQQNNKFMLNNF